ncbi:hypothetical protein [Aquibacillus saliphilus]|uniref:hypothetical protein n=1 Tax=Aquibacillus saliphilus TaxID=1909422 RepID=UPI001CEFD799|nr:hypothetical protein [Aquibacillus saliphilus]
MDSLPTKVATHDYQIKGLDKRIESVEIDNKTLTRLTTLLEEQMKNSNQKDDKHSKVLEKINDNLTNLNSRFELVEKRVGYLEKKRNEALIDLGQLGKTIIFKVIPTVIAALLVAWLVYTLGWK